jgi:hypothetical protein
MRAVRELQRPPSTSHPEYAARGDFMALLYPDRSTLRPQKGSQRKQPPPFSLAGADCIRPPKGIPAPPPTADSLMYPGRTPWYNERSRYRGGGDPPRTAANDSGRSSVDRLDRLGDPQSGVKAYCTGFVPPSHSARSQLQQKGHQQGGTPMPAVDLLRVPTPQGETPPMACAQAGGSAEVIAALRTQVAALTTLLNSGVVIELDDVRRMSADPCTSDGVRLQVWFGASTAASGWQWRVGGIDGSCNRYCAQSVLR